MKSSNETTSKTLVGNVPVILSCNAIRLILQRIHVIILFYTEIMVKTSFHHSLNILQNEFVAEILCTLASKQWRDAKSSKNMSICIYTIHPEVVEKQFVLFLMKNFQCIQN